MEDFLEDLVGSFSLPITALSYGPILQVEQFTDEQFMEATEYLHRQFLLNLEIFERDSFYHRLYVSYLINHTTNLERYVVPSLFIPDLTEPSDVGLIWGNDYSVADINIVTSPSLEQHLHAPSLLLC